MDFFKGKTVVVTGASSGIGRALAEYFAAAGANAVLGARHEDALREIVGRIGAAGGHAAYAVCDVTREADCKRLMRMNRSERTWIERRSLRKIPGFASKTT